jgi:hypothetical protein
MSVIPLTEHKKIQDETVLAFIRYCPKSHHWHLTHLPAIWPTWRENVVLWTNIRYPSHPTSHIQLYLHVRYMSLWLFAYGKHSNNFYPHAIKYCPKKQELPLNLWSRSLSKYLIIRSAQQRKHCICITRK